MTEKPDSWVDHTYPHRQRKGNIKLQLLVLGLKQTQLQIFLCTHKYI